MSDSKLVYSTGGNNHCKSCGKPLRKCQCKTNTKTTPSDGIVRISRESKGRGGKTVSVIRGIPLPEKDLQKLAKQLKSQCGSGGTVKDGVIEIQGDHRELLQEKLSASYNVKLTGG